MTDEMKREAITKWLDYQVDVFNMRHKHRHIPVIIEGETDLQICGVDDYIHIYGNVPMLADFMGFELDWIDRKNAGYYPWEVQFKYKGITFIGLQSQEEYDIWLNRHLQ